MQLVGLSHLVLAAHLFIRVVCASLLCRLPPCLDCALCSPSRLASPSLQLKDLAVDMSRSSSRRLPRSRSSWDHCHSSYSGLTRGSNGGKEHHLLLSTRWRSPSRSRSQASVSEHASAAAASVSAPWVRLCSPFRSHSRSLDVASYLLACSWSSS